MNVLLAAVAIAAVIFIGPWLWWGLANSILTAAAVLGFDRRSGTVVRVGSFIALWITAFVFLLFTGTWHIIGSLVIAILLSLFGNNWVRPPIQTEGTLPKQPDDTTELGSIDPAGDKPSGVQDSSRAPSGVPSSRPLILRDPATCPNCLEPGISLWQRGSAVASKVPRVRCSRCKAWFRVELHGGSGVLPLMRIVVMLATTAMVIAGTIDKLGFGAVVVGVLAGVAAGFVLDRVIGAANVGSLRPLRNAFIDGDEPRRPWSDRSRPDDVVSGQCALDDSWAIELPGEFRFHTDDAKVVLKRPGLTLVIEVFTLGVGESPGDRYTELRRSIPVEMQVVETTTDGIRTLRYCDERGKSKRRRRVHGFAIGRTGYVAIDGEFMEASDLEIADQVVKSCKQRTS